MFMKTHLSDEEIADYWYVTYWNVQVGKNNEVSSVSLDLVLDVAAGMVRSEYQPTDEFVKSAKHEIGQLEWKYSQENGSPKEHFAYCYVMKSDPGRAICSNDHRR